MSMPTGGFKHNLSSPQEIASLLEATLESTADGILVVDANGAIVLSNKKFQELWRIPDEIVRAKDDSKAIEFAMDQLVDPRAFFSKVQELYSKPESESFDILRFKDGRVFERYSRPQKIADKTVGRVWSFRDITKKSQIEEEREAALRQRDVFLSIASHELRTPLTPIALSLQLLERAFSSEDTNRYSKETQLEWVHNCVRQLNRLTRLVNDLLDVSRISTGRFSYHFERASLPELVQRVLGEYQRQLEVVGCEIKLSIPSDVALVGKWDSLRIEAVLINLLVNAMKYAPQRPIHISLAEKGNHAELRVQDFGMGIAQGDHQRIFERFERAVSPDSYGGLGLGLYISTEIVKAHGGTICVESELQKGSTFIVELPLAPL